LINPVSDSEGFSKGIVWRGVVNASQTPQMQAAQNISQVFMGVNLKCASCHDSFINDWTLTDSYGLASVYHDGPLEIFTCDKPTGKKSAARFIYPELGDIDPTADKPARLERLAEIMTCDKNGRLARTIVNRLWAKCFGRGLVEPVDDMEQPAWNPDLLDWLAEDLTAHHYDLRHTLERILTSQAYQLPAVSLSEQASKDFVFRGPGVRRLTAEQFRDALGQLTGVWFAQPAGDFDFSCLDMARPQDAFALRAKWIWNDGAAAQKAAPGTVYFRKQFKLESVPAEAVALVACDNSFTLYLNGNKVTSGKDFAKPAQVDLRPHLKAGDNVLAVAAVNHMPDNTAPPADKPIPDSAANPAGFYFEGNVRADGIACDFGSDSSWQWSAVKVDGWEKSDFADADWKPAVELGDAPMPPWHLGKSVNHLYALKALKDKTRAALVAADPLAVSLGRPNREQVITARSSAATTLQALELTNGETLSKLLRRGAENLVAKKLDAQPLMERLYQQGLGRNPTQEERQLALELVGQPVKREGVEDLLWAMAMLPELQLIY
jgi:hypothetical protein